MKITTLLTILTTLQISAAVYSQSSKVSINVKDISLHDIFNEIEKQTEFRIFYKIDQVDLNRRYDLEAQNVKISEVLGEVLKQSNASYKLIGKIIVITPENYVQQQKVTGTITDAETGTPLPGVNVVVDGTTLGTVTDENGRYSIDVPVANSTITFSFVGYLTEKVPVSGQNVVDVKLVQDVKNLEEVVVVGYGTVRKSDLTGSVTSVKTEQLLASNPRSIQQGLQGKVAGVLITTQGSGVNSVPNIRVRGNRSIGDGWKNDPLFVIDGIPSNGGFELLNPNDVASIEVLKDASATAIYGSRGANGVILVTTKKGERGKVTVEYNADYSIGKLDRIRHLMNGKEYVEFNREAARQYTYDGNGGYTVAAAGYPETPSLAADLSLPYLSQDPYLVESLKPAWASGTWDPSKLRTFDWQMAGFRDEAISQNHSLSIRGGTENTQVYVSGSFTDLKDISLQSFRKRYTLRMNLDQKLGKLIMMGGNVNFSYLDYDNGKGIAGWASPLATPYNSPDGDVTKVGDPALGLIVHPGGEPLQYNSFYDLTGVKFLNRRNGLDIAYYVTINLMKGLSYRANFGADLSVTQNNYFYSHYSTNTAFGDPTAEKKEQVSRGWLFDNILTYNNKIGNHSFGATLVQSNQKSVWEQSQLTASKLPIESQLWNSLGSATTQATRSDYTQWQLQSWLGRVNYSFMDKYLLTASLRYDGSSRLAEGHKWVSFPSLALAWRIKEEGFMKDVNAIDNMKLRLGYGVTGSAAVGTYSTLGQIASSRYNWGKADGAMGYSPSSLSNNSLSWEKTDQYDIGLDFDLINGRISGSLDYYVQNTSDILMYKTLPIVSGFNGITSNIGETQNKGIELSLNTENIKAGKFKWASTVTFAKNNEEITKLASGLQNDIANKWFVGHPIDTYFDYVAAPYVWGYSKEDMDEMAKFNANGSNYKPGDLRLVDLNGDYKITDADRQIRGARVPEWEASMSNTFTYGPFDLYVFMNGAVGHTIYWDPGVGVSGRYNQVMANYWTPTNTKTMFLAPHSGMEMPSNVTAMRYWKGDYLKVKDITLGYNLLDNSIARKVGVRKIRLYVKIQNPFLFTDFMGNDPEGAIAQQRNTNTKALDAYGDPSFTMKTYMFGLNVTF